MASTKSGGGSLFSGRMARLALTNGFVAVARRGAELTWRLGAQRKPPKSSDSEVPLRELLLWSALSGAAVAIAKALAVRQTSSSKRSSRPASDLELAAEPTGERPSGGS